MTSHTNADAGCLLVGEFVEEAELPEALASLGNALPSKARVERRLVASYLDLGSRDDGIKDFTVLLHDKRIVTVRGHALQYVQNASNPTDCGSYGVLLHGGEGAVLVALFRVSEVTGVFSGNLRVSDEKA